MWRELLKKEVLSIGFETIEDKRGIGKIDIFVDEVEIFHDGSSHIALCFIQTEDSKK